MEIMFGLV